MYISKEFEESFKIGSSPVSWRVTPDVNEVKRLLIDTVNHLESDLESKLFVNFTPFELPIGFQVKNHVQALQAANYHEAEHSGKIFTYLKLLVKEWSKTMKMHILKYGKPHGALAPYYASLWSQTLVCPKRW